MEQIICSISSNQNEETFFVKDLQRILLERIIWGNKLRETAWGQLSGGQLSWGAIVRGTFFLGDNCPGAVVRRVVIWGLIILGAIILEPL